MGLPGSQGNRGPKGQPVSTTPRQIYTETCHKYCYSSLWTPQPTVSCLQQKQSSSWNKILIIIFDLGWHRGTWLSRDAGNVWTEGEFYHPLPGIPFKPLFMVKNRNMIARVCLPKRNKQMRFIRSERGPSFGKLVFIHTLKEHHNSHSHWGVLLSRSRIFSESHSRELIKQDKCLWLRHPNSFRLIHASGLTWWTRVMEIWWPPVVATQTLWSWQW